MLVTSGQISMTISSCIVFIFTSLLFLSGYVLQQQTVRSLQAAIRPLPGPASPTSSQNPTSSTKDKPFNNPPGNKSHVTDQQNLRGQSSLDWTMLGYVQILRNHEDVCSALMLFAELGEHESPAQRLLIYPKDWNDDIKPAIGSDSAVQRSMRLLQSAAKGYNISLHPFEWQVEESQDGLAYPITHLLTLRQFRRLLYLNPSGLLLHSAALDRLLTIPTTSPISYFPGQSPATANATLIGAIIQPSIGFSRVFTNTSNKALPYQDAAFFSISGIHSYHVITPYLISRTADLRLQGADFNATRYKSQVAYVQLIDDNIPGPQYDVPRNVFLRSRPVQREAGKIWDNLYKTYRIRRINICGLELEPMPYFNE